MMRDRASPVEVSVIVPVGSRRAPAAELYSEYKAGLDALGRSYEVIFVLDGRCADFAAELGALLERGERFTVISLSRPFGEATALMAGFEQAAGSVIVTLPAYHQIDGSELGKLVGSVGSDDLVVCRRWPRAGGVLERLRRGMFHGLLAWVTGQSFHDLGCGARAFNRHVLEEIKLYGDQHRFLAVLAERQGFKVREIDLRQSPRDRFEGTYQPREYARGVLDIFTVFFLVRFTKKPLRFFGMMGVATFLVGAALVTWLVIERLFFSQPLAERPALLLSSLLVVLGLQLFALGLLGELIIFTNARSSREYKIERILQFPDKSAAHGVADSGPGGRLSEGRASSAIEGSRQ
jgi:glycosyltransferase involved in cell wall biosynthesis